MVASMPPATGAHCGIRGESLASEDLMHSRRHPGPEGAEDVRCGVNSPRRVFNLSSCWRSFEVGKVLNCSRRRLQPRTMREGAPSRPCKRQTMETCTQWLA